jgi:hypothetical protein
VQVLDSEEVEKNVIQQAVTISEQQTPEFQERQAFVHSFTTSESLVHCLIAANFLENVKSDPTE